jgi:hypothetical protein
VVVQLILSSQRQGLLEADRTDAMPPTAVNSMADSTMTDEELRALTFLVIRQRPAHSKPWEEAGTYAHIARLRDRGLNREAITDRAFKTAWDKTAETPGRMANPPKYPVDAPVDNTFRPPKIENECDKHPGQWRGSCGPCAVGRIPAFHDDWQPEPMTTKQAIQAARAAIGKG